MLAGKAAAGNADGPSVRQAQAVRPPEILRRAQQLSRTERSTPVDKGVAPTRLPVAPSREVNTLTSALQKIVEDLEKGEGALDRLINGSLRGKAFSQTDLLALQASMYKYSQELDLTSKLVEKATSGLKDTLKTQV